MLVRHVVVVNTVSFCLPWLKSEKPKVCVTVGSPQDIILSLFVHIFIMDLLITIGHTHKTLRNKFGYHAFFDV